MADKRIREGLPRSVIKRFAGRKVLADLAKERKASIRDIVGRYNQPEFVALRVEFIRRAAAAGLGSPTIGRIIKRDHSTVLYHLRGGRMRKAVWYTSRYARPGGIYARKSR